MKLISRLTSASLLLALTAGTALAQTATPTIEALQASGKDYAGLEWPGTYMRLCVPSIPDADLVIPTLNPAFYPSILLPTPPGGTPPRQNWYAEPQKIGDNLYFLGTRNHNTYALVSKQGEIILIDGNFEYATKAEIHQGLKKMGLDIKKVRYAIYAHAHGDHDGGAHLTQAAIPGVTVVYGAGDWPAVLARTVPHATRNGPENDGTDGRIIRVGDVQVRIVTMPGHTPGTISMLFEYRDNGRRIKVAYVGGTAISFTNPDPAYYDRYIASSLKFAQAAAGFGATALMSNHTEFDLAYFKASTAANRGANNVRSPYLVGQEAVIRYFAVVELCAKAAKLRSVGSL